MVLCMATDFRTSTDTSGSSRTWSPARLSSVESREIAERNWHAVYERTQSHQDRVASSSYRRNFRIHSDGQNQPSRFFSLQASRPRILESSKQQRTAEGPGTHVHPDD